MAGTARVRLRFAKQGKVRWTSHRDVARLWERALRRAEVPVARTEGFNPRPKLSFGLALSTGHESLGEYLDVDLAAGTTVDLVSLPERLTQALPDGMVVQAATMVEPRTPSLQQDVTSCRWQLDVAGLEIETAKVAVAATLEAPELVATRTRKGAEVVDDIRPAILRLTVEGPAFDGEGTRLVADLATHPRSLRPAELLEAVLAQAPGDVPGGVAEVAESARVLRTHQWIEHDGVRTEPIRLDGAPPRSHLIGASA